MESDVPLREAPDWRAHDHYAHLLDADRRVFAWEWLRRSAGYRRIWNRYGEAADSVRGNRIAHRLGLVQLVNPYADGRRARPLWLPRRDPRTLSAIVISNDATGPDRFDILDFRFHASMALDDRDNEQWLLSNGRWQLRLEILEGSLLGGPVSLGIRISGLDRLPQRLDALADLARIATAPGRAVATNPQRRAPRWIAELIAADALRAGASQREIAQHFYGDPAAASWRHESDAYRLRVQRLLRTARTRLVHPLRIDWFNA